MSVAAPLHTASRLIGGRILGLVGQVPERAAPGALLGLLLHLAVDQGDHGLDGQQGAEQGLGTPDAATLLEVLEGVDDAVDLGAAGSESSTRASSSSRVAPVEASLGDVEGHQSEAHGQRA